MYKKTCVPTSFISFSISSNLTFSFVNAKIKSICMHHSNDSHQCPILAADFVIFYYGAENEEAIQAGAGSE